MILRGYIIDLKLFKKIISFTNVTNFYRILMRMSKGDDFIGYRPKSHSPSVPGFKVLSFYSRASMILFFISNSLHRLYH